MLFLQLKSGEYLTLGDDIVIQVFKESGERVRLAVKAPKDLTILRGEVLERTGAQRPDCLIEPQVLVNQLK
ncbi:MAG: carbon storage regulator [Oscillospiraceae bacterium]|nr:carbon storage regulator [Oscillospiraceae bacterium]